jgi:hypothetical protein
MIRALFSPAKGEAINYEDPEGSRKNSFGYLNSLYTNERIKPDRREEYTTRGYGSPYSNRKRDVVDRLRRGRKDLDSAENRSKLAVNHNEVILIVLLMRTT